MIAEAPSSGLTFLDNFRKAPDPKYLGRIFQAWMREKNILVGKRRSLETQRVLDRKRADLIRRAEGGEPLGAINRLFLMYMEREGFLVATEQCLQGLVEISPVTGQKVEKTPRLIATYNDRIRDELGAKTGEPGILLNVPTVGAGLWITRFRLSKQSLHLLCELQEASGAIVPFSRFAATLGLKIDGRLPMGNIYEAAHRLKEALAGSEVRLLECHGKGYRLEDIPPAYGIGI